MNTTTIIELLRHGEVEGKDVYRGVTDDPLTDAGWQQMVKALEGKEGWDIVISSPLQSCSEFAELIASEEDVDCEVINPLKEIDYGLWDGLSPDEILEDSSGENSDLLHAWSKSPTNITPPDGEDYHEFQGRVLKAFKKIVTENQGQKVLIVTHSGVIRLILMDILGMQNEKLFSLSIKNGSYSKVYIHHDDTGQQGCLIEHR
ncbi:MAG: alpha-ribazole phosphatase family protein [Cocleimonas sp.]